MGNTRRKLFLINSNYGRLVVDSEVGDVVEAQLVLDVFQARLVDEDVAVPRAVGADLRQIRFPVQKMSLVVGDTPNLQLDLRSVSP